MIQNILVSMMRNTYMAYGDRDEHRKFNSNLKKYKYVFFYPFFGDDENGDESIEIDPSLFVGFTDNPSEKTMDRTTARGLSSLGDDDSLYVESSLAYMLDHKRMVISTASIEPIPVAKVSWKTLLDAPVLRKGNYCIMCEYVLSHLRLSTATYDFDKTVIEFLQDQNKIELDVVYSTDNHAGEKQSSTIVKYNGTPVGIIQNSGWDGINSKLCVFCRDEWDDMMSYLVVTSGVDKLFRDEYITVIDLERDPDEYTFVPGVTGYSIKELGE